MSVLNICRLCLIWDVELADIFTMSKKFQKSVADIIMECIPFIISSNDRLPPLICRKCYLQLTKVYEFRQLSLRSEQLLKQFLEQIETANVCSVMPNENGHKNSAILKKPMEAINTDQSQTLTETECLKEPLKNNNSRNAETIQFHFEKYEETQDICSGKYKNPLENPNLLDGEKSENINSGKLKNLSENNNLKRLEILEQFKIFYFKQSENFPENIYSNKPEFVVENNNLDEPNSLDGTEDSRKSESLPENMYPVKSENVSEIITFDDLNMVKTTETICSEPSKNVSENINSLKQRTKQSEILYSEQSENIYLNKPAPVEKTQSKRLLESKNLPEKIMSDKSGTFDMTLADIVTSYYPKSVEDTDEIHYEKLVKALEKLKQYENFYSSETGKSDPQSRLASNPCECVSKAVKLDHCYFVNGSRETRSKTHSNAKYRKSIVRRLEVSDPFTNIVQSPVDNRRDPNYTTNDFNYVNIGNYESIENNENHVICAPQNFGIKIINVEQCNIPDVAQFQYLTLPCADEQLINMPDNIQEKIIQNNINEYYSRNKTNKTILNGTEDRKRIRGKKPTASVTPTTLNDQFLERECSKNEADVDKDKRGVELDDSNNAKSAVTPIVFVNYMVSDEQANDKETIQNKCLAIPVSVEKTSPPTKINGNTNKLLTSIKLDKQKFKQLVKTNDTEINQSKPLGSNAPLFINIDKQTFQQMTVTDDKKATETKTVESDTKTVETDIQPGEELYKIIDEDMVKKIFTDKNTTFIKFSKKQFNQLINTNNIRVINRGGSSSVKNRAFIHKQMYDQLTKRNHKEVIPQNSACDNIPSSVMIEMTMHDPVEKSDAETIQKDAVCAETIQKNAVCAETIEKDAVCAETIQKNAVCAETIQKDAICAETIQKNAVCAETIGKDAVCAETIQKNAVCAETIGKDAVCAETIQKNAVCAETDKTAIEDIVRAGLFKCKVLTVNISADDKMKAMNVETQKKIRNCIGDSKNAQHDRNAMRPFNSRKRKRVVTAQRRDDGISKRQISSKINNDSMENTKKRSKKKNQNAQIDNYGIDIIDDERNRSDTANVNYTCHFCRKVFADRDLLRNHRCHSISDKIYQCNFCNKLFIFKDFFKEHDCKNSVRCEICQYHFATNEELYKHVSVHADADDYLFKCSYCKDMFVSLDDLTVHECVSVKVKPRRRCSLCKIGFDKLSETFEHKMSHANSVDHPCPICRECFFDRDGLKMHANQHVFDARPFPCDDCDERFASEQRLSAHRIAHVAPYQCNICEAYFRNIEDLQVHGIFHKCESCDKCFLSKRHYYMHKIEHKMQEVFTCDKCHKQFELSTQLTVHKNIAHYYRNVMDFKEEIILQKQKRGRKRTSSKSELSQSKVKKRAATKRKWKSPRNVPDLQCARSVMVKLVRFDDPTNLDKKEFWCAECKKIFPSTNDLIMHDCINKNIFYPECDICSIKFITIEDCLAHLRNHK